MKFNYLNNEIRFIKSNINLDLSKEEKKELEIEERRKRWAIKKMIEDRENKWAKNKICPKCGLYMNLLNECDLCD